MRLVDALLVRTIDIFSEEAKTVIRIFSRTHPKLFTKLGKDLHIRCSKITSYQEEHAKKQSTTLLKNPQKHLNNNAEFKNIIKFDMAKHSIERRWE